MIKILFLLIIFTYAVGFVSVFCFNMFDEWRPFNRHDLWISVFVNLVAAAVWPLIAWHVIQQRKVDKGR